ncbi:hypothetical protein, partial [Salmonella enterica]
PFLVYVLAFVACRMVAGLDYAVMKRP